MNRRTIVSAAALVLTLAAGLLAAVSQSFVDWARGPAQFLMTKEDAQAWKAVKTDAEAQNFVDLFWARRDPTPTTPANELKMDFEARVKVADERFTSGKLKGSMSDRGKFLILLGFPTRSTKANQQKDIRQDSDVIGIDAEGMATEAKLPTEVWIYEGPQVPKFAGTFKFDLAFVDQYRTNLYKVGRGASGGSPTDLAKKAVQAAIVSPNLTQVPVYETRRSEARPVEAAPAASAPKAAFSNEAFGAVVAEIKAGKTSAYKPLFATYAEGVTPTGEYFVPFQIFVPGSSGLTAESNVTFFGTIEDASGQIVGMYEEPAKLKASRDDFFYDKTLVLPSGKYKGYFALAVDGKPVQVATATMDLTSLDKDEPGVSKLILSNNIYALSVAQQPTDPFAFGGIKVVPKSDRTFKKSDELWYFIELRNPGVGEDGKTKLQVKVDVEGTINKKKINMSSPMQEAPAEALKGVPNHFGLGTSIPLSGFTPGDYTLKVKLLDTIKAKTYTFQEPFKVVADKQG